MSRVRSFSGSTSPSPSTQSIYQFPLYTCSCGKTFPFIPGDGNEAISRFIKHNGQCDPPSPLQLKQINNNPTNINTNKKTRARPNNHWKSTKLGLKGNWKKFASKRKR